MPFAPSDISGLQFWLRADDLALSNNDPVGTWADRGGGGHDFTQATSGNKPLFKSGVRAGLPGVLFDNSDDHLDSADLSSLFPSAGTVFIVYDPNSDTGYQLARNVANDSWGRYDGDGTGYAGLFRTTRISSYPSSMPTTGFHTFAIKSSSSTYVAYKDGSAQSAQTAGYNAGTTWLLGDKEGGTPTRAFGGYLFEVIAYDSALSDADVTSLHNYAAALWDPPATAAAPTVVAVGAVPAVTAKGNSTAAPDRVAGIGAVPAPTGTGVAAVVAPVVVGTGAVPAATAFGTAAGVATPAATVGVGLVPSSTVTGAGVAAPDRVAGMGAVPTATGGGGTTAFPARVAGVGAVPAPTAGAISNATALPGRVAGAGRVPSPTFPSGIPVAGPTITLAVSAAADDILDTTAPHGLTAGQSVEFVSLTGGTGLSRNQQYYVLAASLGSTTFKVSLTPGGAPVNFTTDVTAGSARLNSFAVSDVSALWVMNIKDADGSAIETHAAPFMKARLIWTVENAGGGAAEIDVLGSDVPVWTAPRRLVIRGERDWSGELSNAHRSGKPVAVGVAGEAGWTVSALGLIHRLDYRIVRHVFVENDNADKIVHALLDEAQLNQNNGDMGFHMGDVHGTTIVRERDYCFGVGIGDAIRELAAIGRGFDWEMDADQRLNIWNGSRGTDTGRTLSESQCQGFDIDYDTAEMLTTVSALADPSDPFGPRHRMSRTGKAVDFGRREVAIDTDVISDIDTNPNYEDELYDAADALLKTDGGAFVTVKAMWTSDKAPWSMADVWLEDNVTVSMPDPLAVTLGSTVDMRVTDVTVTIEPMPPRASAPPIYWIEYGFAGLVRDLDLTHGDADGDN